jgi:hypothetical protein
VADDINLASPGNRSESFRRKSLGVGEGWLRTRFYTAWVQILLIADRLFVAQPAFVEY